MKIIIADDHALVREGVAHTLQAEWSDLQALQADNGPNLVALLRQNTDADIVLMDLFMPGADGFGLLENICNSWPDMKIVVLSASENSSHMRKAIDIGASGYIPKSLTREVMIGAMRLILAGGIYIPPASLNEEEQVSDFDFNEADIDPVLIKEALPKLTVRQRDVLALLAGGRTNKEIAEALDLSEYTVKIHITAIFKALKVSNRTQAVIVARKFGVKPSSETGTFLPS